MSITQSKAEQALAEYQKGNIDQAKVTCEKILATESNNVDALYLMGLIAYQTNNLQHTVELMAQVIAVKPDFAEAYATRGNALYMQEELEAAVASYDQAISLNPHLAAVYSNRGNALQALKQFTAAVANYDQAIRLDSNFAEAYSNRGNALLGLQQPEAAVASYDQAIRLNPNFADAYSNRGNALLELQQAEAAVVSYDQAIELNPNFADAYSNRGNALFALQRLEEAVVSYDQAIRLNPNFTDAYFNRGLALQALRQYEEAIKNYCELININRMDKNYWHNFLTCLTKSSLLPYSNQVADHIVQLLDQKAIVKADETLPTILRFLDQNSFVIRFLDIENYINNFSDTIQSIKNISKSPLLFKLLKLIPITDIRYENALNSIRKLILIHNDKYKKNQEILKMQYAIAHQCFINEYVYFQTNEELDLVVAIEKEVEDGLNKKEKIDTLKIITLASYKPLYSFAWINHLIDLEDSEDYQDLIKVQVEEYLEEQKIRNSIEILSPIKNQISQEVQALYELNPYPRWVATQVYPNPITIKELFDLVKLNPEFRDEEYSEAPEILMGGCGTGQNSIGTASSFKDSKLTAVDLSLNSLSYAVRKTKELHVNNIKYIQADILDLRKLNKQFDIVESSGVLHHMSNPLEGWRILVDCTKPKGLMKICLYSRIARKDIIRNRELMKDRNLSGTLQDIRFLRNEIIKGENRDFIFLKNIPSMLDFYTTSGCRDLLFHVQEHQFSLIQLDEIIKNLGLKFIGFAFYEHDEVIRDKFKQEVPNGSEYSLLDWHKFELNNPSTFISMYQLWLKKI